MLYSTNSRFPTVTTIKQSNNKVHNVVKIQPYKVNDLITNETLASPFKQVENTLNNLLTVRNNER